MIAFDFIYFSIYSFVPDKAIFGKRDVACTFLSCSTAMFLLGLFCLSEVFLNYRINLAFATTVLIGGLFILARVIYLKPAKLRSMHRRFRKIPKWGLKTVGILYVLLCFVGFVLCIMKVSLIETLT